MTSWHRTSWNSGQTWLFWVLLFKFCHEPQLKQKTGGQELQLSVFSSQYEANDFWLCVHKSCRRLHLDVLMINDFSPCPQSLGRSVSAEEANTSPNKSLFSLQGSSGLYLFPLWPAQHREQFCTPCFWSVQPGDNWKQSKAAVSPHPGDPLCFFGSAAHVSYHQRICESQALMVTGQNPKWATSWVNDTQQKWWVVNFEFLLTPLLWLLGNLHTI